MRSISAVVLKWWGRAARSPAGSRRCRYLRFITERFGEKITDPEPLRAIAGSHRCGMRWIASQPTSLTRDRVRELVAGTILASIGDTPLVPLRRIGAGLRAALWVKLESFNPGGSVTRTSRSFPSAAPLDLFKGVV